MNPLPEHLDLGSIQEDFPANKQESSPPSISNSMARRVSNVGGPVKFCRRMREGGRQKVQSVKFFPKRFQCKKSGDCELQIDVRSVQGNFTDPGVNICVHECVCVSADSILTYVQDHCI